MIGPMTHHSDIPHGPPPPLDDNLSLASLRARRRWIEAQTHADRMPTVSAQPARPGGGGGPAAVCWSTYRPRARRRQVAVAQRSAILRGAYRATLDKYPTEGAVADGRWASTHVAELATTDAVFPTITPTGWTIVGNAEHRRGTNGPRASAVRATYAEPMHAPIGSVPRPVLDMSEVPAAVPPGAVVWLSAGRWAGGRCEGGTVLRHTPREAAMIADDAPTVPIRKGRVGGRGHKVPRPENVPTDAVRKRVRREDKRSYRWIAPSGAEWTDSGQLVRQPI